jgi:diketogulonate reductase-like aldo/keto reductase
MTGFSGEAAPTVRLDDGIEIPQLGFGVFQITPDEVQARVEEALEAGYRHIDTAAAYNNEQGVGRALAASGLARDDVFITTKLRNGEQGRTSAADALRNSLERLGLEYLDLYLIHWPSPARDAYVDSWRAMIEAKEQGLVRAIGVSNFLPHHLERVIAETGVTPAVDQIELHPYFSQPELTRVLRELGVAVEAYSPLGQGRDLDDPTIAEIAATVGRSPAQIILRWHLQHGYIAIPKASSRSRMAANLDVLGFELSEADMLRIDSLDTGERIGGDPDTFEISQIR